MRTLIPFESLNGDDDEGIINTHKINNSITIYAFKHVSGRKDCFFARDNIFKNHCMRNNADIGFLEGYNFFPGALQLILKTDS